MLTCPEFPSVIRKIGVQKADCLNMIFVKKKKESSWRGTSVCMDRCVENIAFQVNSHMNGMTWPLDLVSVIKTFTLSVCVCR